MNIATYFFNYEMLSFVYHIYLNLFFEKTLSKKSLICSPLYLAKMVIFNWF